MMSVVQVGLGPLGQRIAREAVARGFEIVGAVDPAADKVGKDLGDLCAFAPAGIPVRATLQEAMRSHSADVAVLATVSSLKSLIPQIEACADMRLSMVSTCEELVYPWTAQPELARHIDTVCLNHGVACLGTGVNPGFLMDFLPAVLTAVCGRVDQVRVLRFQDAAARRVPFQKKIGAGLTPDEFRAKASEGVLRHVGLVESMDFIAARLGWVLDRRSESLEPVIATEEIGTGYVPIRPGMARGVEQIGRGFIGSDEVITLHFRAAVGEPRSFDRIIIDGEPRLDATLDGGVNGDTATCAIVLNAIRSVASAPPGLRTMADVWPPSFYRPGRREIGGL